MGQFLLQVHESPDLNLCESNYRWLEDPANAGELAGIRQALGHYFRMLEGDADLTVLAWEDLVRDQCEVFRREVREIPGVKRFILRTERDAKDRNGKSLLVVKLVIDFQRRDGLWMERSPFQVMSKWATVDVLDKIARPILNLSVYVDDPGYVDGGYVDGLESGYNLALAKHYWEIDLRNQLCP